MLHNKKYISIKLNEPKLKKRNRELSLLLEISDILSTSMESKDLLSSVLSRVLKFFTVEAGRIYLLDISGQYLNLAAHQGIETEGLEKVNINDGFSGIHLKGFEFYLKVDELSNVFLDDRIKWAKLEPLPVNESCSHS